MSATCNSSVRVTTLQKWKFYNKHFWMFHVLFKLVVRIDQRKVYTDVSKWPYRAKPGFKSMSLHYYENVLNITIKVHLYSVWLDYSYTTVLYSALHKGIHYILTIWVGQYNIIYYERPVSSLRKLAIYLIYEPITFVGFL